MARETLAVAALQSGILFLFVWLAFRLVPSLSPNAKAWVWRLAFLKPLVAIIPLAAVTLHVLPAPPTPESIIENGIKISTAQTDSLTTNATARIVNSSKSTPDPLLLLWALGVLVVAGSGIVGAAKVSSIVRNAEPIHDEEIQFELQNLLDRAGIRQKVRLLSSTTVKTPLVAGGFTPSIVLPVQALQLEPLGDIRMMMAHEVAHIARRDLAWFGLAWIVQSLFFFNPVVWVAVRGARLDHESATDRHALILAEASTQTYAEMLLRATVVARTSIAPGVLPMSESYRTIHRRLEAMKHFQSKPSRWRMSAIGAFALVIVGLLPTYQFAQASSSKDEDTTKKVLRRSKSQTPIAPSKSKATNTKGTPSKALVPPTVAPTKKAPALADKYAIDPTIIPTRPDPTQKTPAPTAKAAIDPNITPSGPAPTRKASSNAHQIDENITPSSPVPAANSSGPDVSASPTVAVEPRSAVAPSSPADSGMIDLEMKDADVRVAINVLFKQANQSYIMEDGVKGTVTLSLKSIPFNICLKTLLEAVGASYVIDGAIYKILAKKSPL